MKQHSMSEKQAAAHFLQIHPECIAAYQALTESIQVLLWQSELIPRDTSQDPRYKAFERLVKNAALEICGHPMLDGSSLDLMMKLHQLVEEKRGGVWTESTAKTLYDSLDGYLGRIRRFMLETVYEPIGWGAESIPQHYTQVAIETLMVALSESAAIPRWYGIATRHFLQAAVYLMKAALQFTTHPSTSSVIYAGAQVGSAFTDIYYAIREVNELGTRTPRIFRTLLSRAKAATEPAVLADAEA